MKINLIINNDIIKGYYAFKDENKPWIEIDDPNKINLGFDKFINNHLEQHQEESRQIKIMQEKVDEIYNLKRLLDESDYKLLKYMDGELSEQEYLPIKEQRKDWRAQINKLEQEVNNRGK